MPLAVFKDLCIDAVDPSSLGSFWSEVLNLELHHQDNGDSYLTGPTAAHTIWINKVPEAKTAKHRMHLDIHGSTAQVIEAIGGNVVDADSFGWVVMTDPEGGEFCLFKRDPVPEDRLYELAMDCADHEMLSRWWASVLGGDLIVDESGYSYIDDVPNTPFECFTFVPVDEPKVVKNRIHIDVVAPDKDALLGAGASLIRPRDDEIGWDVLADPEGNEFCVFTPE